MEEIQVCSHVCVCVTRGGWRKILLTGVLRVLSGVKGGFRHSGGGGGLVLVSQVCVTTQTFVEIEEKFRTPFFPPSQSFVVWE
jgi:hypothetical protein